MDVTDDFQMVSCKSEMAAMSCKECGTFLTYTTNIVSKSFRGTTGPAVLCQDVVNVQMGDAVEKDLITGKHTVRDLTCSKCKHRLGWMYEKASEESQKYKEGKSVLELPLVNERAIQVGDEHLPATEDDEWVMVPTGMDAAMQA
jgi:RNase P subunit RPR2